jgi:hypothetical protein
MNSALHNDGPSGGSKRYDHHLDAIADDRGVRRPG